MYLRQSITGPGGENVLFSVPEIDDFRNSSKSLRGIAEYSQMTFTLKDDADPVRFNVGLVTGNYFQVMGLSPVAGRPLNDGDDGTAVPPVMVLTHEYWLMAVCLFLVGFGFGYGNVIWGTLLQRRVPRHMLGRISSLDFFVSLALMPLSMALAGPLAEVVPVEAIFIAAGVIPLFLGAVAYAAARMPKDEIAHPLDH